MRNWGVAALFAACVVLVSCSSGSSAPPPLSKATQEDELGGNIHPSTIQIDGPATGSPGADLFPDAGTPLNVGAGADWVKDNLPNRDAGCLGSDGIAECITPGVTGADAGTGHWNGLRIVDGVGDIDDTVFAKGGKENDLSTWDVQDVTVGSSKYDFVQAYLANNQSHVFFGMERQGNNGTTAFDFEFNQFAPNSLKPDGGTCSPSPLIPCRTVGDILFTFEMQGAGNSGSATPFVFRWNGSAYTTTQADGGVFNPADAGVFSTINDSDNTRSGPWGHVDEKGVWTTEPLARFTFAEAAAPIVLLPGVSACGGSAYVQIRTRASATDNSDLKDTSKIFLFQFLGLNGTASITPTCDQGFNFSASAQNADGVTLDGGCSWTFSDGTSSTLCSGFHATDAGTFGAGVQLADPSNPSCAVTIDAGTVGVFPTLVVNPLMTATCSNSFLYDAGVSGGAGSGGTVAFNWTFDGGGTVNPATSNTKAGSVAVGTANVNYFGNVVATETRDGGLQCTATANASARPLGPLNIDLNLNTTVLTCQNGLSDDAVTYGRSITGGNGTYIVTWDGGVGCAVDAGTCSINPPDSAFCATGSLSATVRDTSGLCPPVTSETENYSKITTINASDNP